MKGRLRVKVVSPTLALVEEREIDQRELSAYVDRMNLRGNSVHLYNAKGELLRTFQP